jgi:hypothetical protein
MKKIFAAAMVATLSGCFTTPVQIRAEGDRYNFVTAAPPDQTAACLARAADEWPRLNPFTSAMRPLPQAGGHEVVIRIVTPDATTAAVADVIPASAGSAVRVSMWSMLFDGSPFLAHWIPSCSLKQR